MFNSSVFTGSERYEDAQDVHIIPCASKSPDSDPHSLENDVSNFECARSYRSSSSEPPSLSDFPFDDGCSSSSESHRPYSPYHGRDDSSDEEPVVTKGIDRFFESSDSEDGSETRQSNREWPDQSPEKACSQNNETEPVSCPSDSPSFASQEKGGFDMFREGLEEDPLSAFIEKAVAETLQVYKTVSPEQLQRFHEQTMKIARELQQKYQKSSSE